MNPIKIHRLGTTSLSLNSEARCVCTGPRKGASGRRSKPADEIQSTDNRIESLDGITNKEDSTFNYHISKQPKAPIILKLCSVLLSLLFILFNLFLLRV